jgi:DNA-binding CsgD family transcriptional regulator
MTGPFNYNRRRQSAGIDVRTVTARQIEVLHWLAEGKMQGEIATIMGLRTRTVAFHLYNSMRVLDCRTVTQTVARAIRWGLMS